VEGHEIAQGVHIGQEDASAYIATHYGWMMWLARNQYGVDDYDESADVVQVASIKVWQKWETWQDRGRGRDAWVATIVGNAARDWQRTCSAKHRAINRLPPERIVDAEELAILRLTLLEVWALLTALERWLAAMIAAGFQQAERALKLGVPQGTIKSWDYRMRHRAALAIST
jgi:RNA polymerase sigma factor (sigma-70 family)